MATLSDAIKALAQVCDGAQARDTTGFNKPDSNLGKTLATVPEAQWSEYDKYIAWKMLYKYTEQLSRLGVDYNSIPVPPEPTDTIRTPPQVSPKPPPVTPKTISLADNQYKGKTYRVFKLQFVYDPNLVNAVKRLEKRFWEPVGKYWGVPVKPEYAAPVLKLGQENGFTFSDEALEMIQSLVDQYAETAKIQATNLEESKATKAEVEIQGLGGTLRPFQSAGVAYALKNKRVFIADEMGLGKTIQALATIQGASAYPALIICPASLKLNWKRESEKWLLGKSVTVLNGKEQVDPSTYDVVVINYDVLGKWLERLLAIKFKTIVLDECHMIKNYKAARTEYAKQLAKGREYRLLMSGTPLLNRPQELLSQLGVVGQLDAVGGFWNVAKRYCGYTEGRGFGEPAHLEELNEKLRRTCYIRRLKADVLKELPPKQIAMVPVEITNRKEYDKLANSEIDGEPGAHLVRIEELKQLAAKGKMNSAIAWVKEFLDSGEKLVLFAWHRETAEILSETFAKELGTEVPIVIGGIDKQKVQDAVDRFQDDPTCRLIVLNIASGGVGLTLTAASNVAFVEFAWNPGQMMQAEDRVHRIGQTDNVTAWYLLAENTIDEDIFNLIQAKRRVVDAATEGALFEDVDKYSMASELIRAVRERASKSN